MNKRSTRLLLGKWDGSAIPFVPTGISIPSIFIWWCFSTTTKSSSKTCEQGHSCKDASKNEQICPPSTYQDKLSTMSTTFDFPYHAYTSVYGHLYIFQNGHELCRTTVLCSYDFSMFVCIKVDFTLPNA